MRFHHSTRRGRTKFSQAGAAARQGAASHTSLSNRWAQLSYCRQTNIHFNRRLPVEVPESLLRQQAAAIEQLESIGNSGGNQPTLDLFGDAHLAAILSEPNSNNSRAAELQASCTTSDPHARQPPIDSKTLEQHINELKLTATDPTTSQGKLEARLSQRNNTCTSGDMGPNNNNSISSSSTSTIISNSKSKGKSNTTSSGGSSTSASRRTMRLFHQDSKSKLVSNRHGRKRADQLAPDKSSDRGETTSATDTTSGDSASASASGDKLRKAPEWGGRNSKIDIESARAKLIAQVEKHPFWSNKAAKRMRLLDIDERRILIYELISYCEKRDLEWRYEPYRGGLAGGTGATTGAGGGVRRVPSPMGERVPPPQSQLVSSLASSISGDSQRSLGSLSQPASPLRSVGPNRSNRAEATFARQLSSTKSNSTLQQQLTPPRTNSPQQPYRFAYEESPPTPLSPASLGGGRGDAATGHQRRQYQQQQRDTPTHSTTGRLDKGQRQAVRRSCSSAATSPVHSPSSLSEGGATGANFDATAAATTTTSLLQSYGEPRPLPSAELVWSIEPPEHLRPAPFVSYIHTTTVPDTSFVKRCHGCQGRGRLKCTSCYGVGYEVCISCSGRGTTKHLAAGAGSGGQQSSQHGRGDSSGATVGSMWSNASESGRGGGGESRLGSGRHEEPGGITGASGHSGSSAWTTETCHLCHGAGQKRCWICAGRAYNTCTACAGTGQLRCYLNLNITWMNHRDECALNNTDSIIPRDRLKLSSGLLLADETAARLKPLASRSTCTQLKLLELSRASTVVTPTSGGSGLSSTTAGEQPPSNGTSTTMVDTCYATKDGATGPTAIAIQQQQQQQAESTAATTTKVALAPGDNNANGNHKHFALPRAPTQHLLEQVVKPSELSQLHLFSSKLLEKHTATYGRSERLLMQRHRVTQIECYLVNWEWKRRRGHFVIYGDERKVYIAKYPFKSICNIT